jgi:hypothetical protein
LVAPPGARRRAGARCRVALAAALLSIGAAAAAQDELDVRVNYVYAAQFGFGSYSLGGLRVNVYTLPIPITWENVFRDWDLNLRVPIVYGRYRFSARYFEDNVRISVRSSTNSLAVAPQLRLDIPLADTWWVSPMVSWGFGSTFDTSGSAQIGDERASIDVSESWFHTYQAGVSTLYQRRWRGFTGNLGGALLGAGDDFFDEDGNTERYGTFRVGAEARHPLGFEIAGRTPDAGLYFIYDRFFPSLQFTQVRRAALEVDNQYEVGLTFGAASPLQLPWVGDLLDELRVGASYVTGDGLDAWRLSTGFPF